MRIGTMISRRGLLALVAAFVMGAAAVPQAEAAKRAPRMKGHWHGHLNSEMLEDYEFLLDVETQKKTGRITGEVTTEEGTFNLTGKIKKNRQLESSFNGELNGQPVTIAFTLQVARNAKKALGSYVITGEGGVPIDSGTVEIEREHDHEH